ncbi:hypothetical protein K493DRAFT_302717 [Basidiobolus meristosporus CBS 931.73]|uniref:Uncharacterized protein n=1 Tax=Basidiobolus meristosporus CBS 931.73 TaxID=1314790 RepID=A0A1Y1Y5Q1_9FUNG|nr:hypothetical protein K493DRAFT_302717 [Basidiobolus meristosporus CBS 931.73]|eukprot:ORX93351.1 hypothetical protein K493DRAFT_302717 [Basidiobolus meristosporus CBS 931.73]
MGLPIRTYDNERRFDCHSQLEPNSSCQAPNPTRPQANLEFFTQLYRLVLDARVDRMNTDASMLSETDSLLRVENGVLDGDLNPVASQASLDSNTRRNPLEVLSDLLRELIVCEQRRQNFGEMA